MSLQTIIQQIKNADTPGENTALRVGSAFEQMDAAKRNILDSLSKSETIDMLNAVKIQAVTGSKFIGDITPQTSIPSGNVWGFAEEGTYPNANGIIIPSGKTAILSRVGNAWSMTEVTPEIVQNITNNITQNITNVTQDVDPSQIVPTEALNNNAGSTIASNVYKRVCQFTGVEANYREVTIYFDGSGMDDSKVDGILYQKKDGKYYADSEFLALRRINVKRMGAKGDGITDDVLVLQKCCDLVGNSAGGYTPPYVFLPTGTFMVSVSLKIPDYSKIQGSGKLNTKIKALPGLVGGVVRNMHDGYHYYAKVADMTVEGGDYAYLSDQIGDVANCSFINVYFKGATNTIVYFKNTLQTTTFSECIFDGSGTNAKGLKVDGFFNMNNFNDCQFVGVSDDVIISNTSEVNNFNGCRFESGGALNKIVLNLNEARNMNFNGCYFENIHTKLLKETNSFNSVNFNDCHFTYGYNGSINERFTFQSDGVVIFKTPHWYLDSTLGAEKNMLIGDVGEKFGGNSSSFFLNSSSKRHKEFISKTFNLTQEQPAILLDFRRTEDAIGENGQLSILTGKLVVNYFALTQGSASVWFSQEYMVTITSVVGGDMILILKLLQESKDDKGVLFTVEQDGTATNTDLKIKCTTSMSGADTNQSGVQCHFTFLSTSVNGRSFITL